MFKHKSTKSAIFTVVAVLMVVTVMLTACNGTAFKPVEMPASATPEGNGGNVVKYGEWLYYVNGYQSSTTGENTYQQVEARTAAIARIKIVDLESLFAVYDDDKFTTSSSRTKEIARIVAEKAEIVVPKYYYSNNTTTTQINGIYIFNDRLYMLTPNDELTAGGNSLTNQSVLTSFKLDGSDEQRHYTFESNSAQVLFSEKDGKLLATYIMSSEIGCINVNEKSSVAKIEKISNAQMDVAGQAVFYTNEDKAICKLNAGEAEGKVLVSNEKDSSVTYTISNVNNGYVYYTKADTNNSSVDGTHVYYAKEGLTETATAWESSAPSANWYGYNETIVYATSEAGDENVTLYGIYVLTNSDGSARKQIVNPQQNDSAITFNRLEGDILYYTSNNVAYKVDLSAETPAPEAIGLSLASANGWSVPDIVYADGFNYVITLGNGSVSAVKFDKETKSNSSSATITIVEPVEEE